jgi:uncharacterized membrane protein
VSLRNPRTAGRFIGAVLVTVAIMLALSVFLIPVFGQAGGSVISLAIAVGIGRFLKP